MAALVLLFFLCLIIKHLCTDNRQSLSYKLGKNCGKAVKNFAERD